MKILVTGADGFIGSHLTEKIANNGHEVLALSQYNSFNHWGWLEDIKDDNNIKIISGDIRDQNFCNDICNGVDVIYNLAALIAIPFSYSSPKSYLDTNVIGTYNICKSALDNDVKRIIHTSTSEVYGTAEYVPIDEKHPLKPQSPYSASKIGADALAMSFFNSYNLPLTILRPFNTYGPRQSARAIIPNVISQIASKKEFIEVGDISPTRDFSYVFDTCDAFLKVAEKPSTLGKVINTGSNSEISIKETIRLIQKIMGTNLEIKQSDERMRPSNSEVRRLYCDNSLLYELTGFSNKYNFQKGLEETIEWFEDKENLKKYKTLIYNK